MAVYIILTLFFFAEFKVQRAASLYAVLNAWTWSDYIAWYSFHK